MILHFGRRNTEGAIKDALDLASLSPPKFYSCPTL